jgi:DNA modification methylase
VAKKNSDGGRKKQLVAVTYRKVFELKPATDNPRLHSRKQVRQIARSIETFGFVVPVLLDRNLGVIAGHGRILACQQLEIEEVPTISLEHLTEAQAHALMIADNRLTEVSVWDDRLLAIHLKDLASQDLDFNLEVLGFDMGEIDFRIEGLDTQPDASDIDDLAMVPTGPAVTKFGDRWQLGEHRVACANALDPDAYAALFGEETATLVFTDPPYNLKIQGNVSGRGSIHHREFRMASGEMNEATFTEFLTSALKLHARHSADGSLHFVCIDWRHLQELLSAGREVFTELKNLCVWAKDNGGMGSLYRSQHELIFVFKRGRASHRNNVMLGIHGRNRSNLWQYPCANSFSRSGDEGDLRALHPTVKPVALVADAILDASSRGEIVLDGFLGSGTTLIAAERTGRRCYGLEIDPGYVDVTIRRWQKYTRQDARHAETGQTFSTLECGEEERCDASK